MPSVYLVGSIKGLSYDEAMGWREEAVGELSALGYAVYSPMRAKERIREALGATPIPDHHVSFVDPFPRDMHDLRMCDYVLAYLPSDHPTSVGSLIELGVAHEARKTVVIVTDSPRPLHPFLEGVADAVVETWDQAWAVFEAFLPVVAGRTYFVKGNGEIDVMPQPFGREVVPTQAWPEVEEENNG